MATSRTRLRKEMSTARDGKVKFVLCAEIRKSVWRFTEAGDAREHWLQVVPARCEGWTGKLTS